jgi:hypothetical protein
VQAYFTEAAPDLAKYYAFAIKIVQAIEATSTASQLKIKPDPTCIHWNNIPPPPHH